MTNPPKPIVFKDHIFDFAFHPQGSLVAVGLINGQVQCYNYSTESPNNLAWSTQISKKSCRGVDFTSDGAHIMSISRDKSLQALDVATGRLLYKIPKAHKHAINKLCKLDTHLTATGDDDGIVKIWDMRTCKITQEYKVHNDYVADMNYNQSKSSLLVAGGDGLLSIHDIRKPTSKIALSLELDDELLSIAVLENSSKVIAGSQSGALYTWEWNQWDTSRKWLGHPNSIDSICKLDEQTICTGGSDGLLRMVTVQPYKFEGVLGDHGEDFPIECIKMDNHQRYLASCGHDLHLRFWDVQFLFDDDDEQGIDTSHKRKPDQKDEGAPTRSKRTLFDKHASSALVNKFDPNDVNLDGILEINRKWAEAVREQDPNFFSNIANKQTPKILWIGCSDSRVPANIVLQLNPGEVFVHRNIANVVNHADLNCLSVLQYAVEVLKVEHIIVCGHYNCGGVGAAHGHQQFGLIDNWLRNIKDVYRLHQSELEAIKDDNLRLRRLIELNVINSAENVCHSTIVQNAWQKGQKLTVHAWAYDIEDGVAKKLEWAASDAHKLQSIYHTQQN
ncbi:carbonic anhydrase [Gilbertella persicaria]|uniref:carbonic anhydrase n=1 Tax=Gilbertella persicaria TaxID=101096 RepID=UPI00221E7082|nr:carbonic anhydrase [Gilbertella persicaria]KAI8076636.1 carbonic anhydrase [Gilbertella persicaria]